MRTPSRVSAIFVAAAVAAFACDKPDKPKAEVSAATASAKPESKIDLAKTLALAPPNGAANVDLLLTQLQRGAKEKPDKSDYWILLGRAWVRKARETSDPGFYLNADACADVALDLNPDDKLAADLQALVLQSRHKFEDARALAQKTVDRHPDDLYAQANLSDALLELGRFEEAAARAQAMMDLKPSLPAYVRASYIEWLRGDFSAAVASAKLAIDSGADARDPEPRAWAITQAAYLFWFGNPDSLTGKARGGDFDGADEGFQKALDALSEYPPALVGRGRVALAKGDGRRAAELFARAYKESPLVETAWLLGDARALAGDPKGADEMFARVEKGDDGRTLSLYYATKGKNPERALALAEAERKVRGDIYTDDAYAWALFRNGKLAEAKSAIDHALRLGTKDPRLMYHAGAIRIALGDKAAGKKLVKDALTLNPKFELTGAAEAERLLKGGDAGP